MASRRTAPVEEEIHRRLLADIGERRESMLSSFRFEVRLARRAAVSLVAVMATGALFFALLRPGARSEFIVMVAVVGALSLVLLLWLWAWFRRSLSEELETIERLIDDETSRYLSAIGQGGHVDR